MIKRHGILECAVIQKNQNRDCSRRMLTNRTPGSYTDSRSLADVNGVPFFLPGHGGAKVWK